MTTSIGKSDDAILKIKRPNLAIAQGQPACGRGQCERRHVGHLARQLSAILEVHLEATSFVGNEIPFQLAIIDQEIHRASVLNIQKMAIARKQLGIILNDNICLSSIFVWSMYEYRGTAAPLNEGVIKPNNGALILHSRWYEVVAIYDFNTIFSAINFTPILNIELTVCSENSCAGVRRTANLCIGDFQCAI
ncbi:hypothetical protein [Pseudomonas graminis]|uniref:hypothetical protein n=1 Tax=Pseudomonas graminis TaxID=158627 RepID=UPI0020B109FB|nr:hypothetical protein [Pseudomonas graminis]